MNTDNATEVNAKVITASLEAPNPILVDAAQRRAEAICHVPAVRVLIRAR